MTASKYWGTSGVRYKFNLNGWYIEVQAFTFTEPKAWAGKTSWQYRMSRNSLVPGVWTVKNPRGRNFATRCFTTMEEAKAAAEAAAEN